MAQRKIDLIAFHLKLIIALALITPFNFSYNAMAQENAKTIVADEKLKRQAVVDEVNALLKESENLYSKEKFYEANAKCVQAKAKLENITGPFVEQQKKKVENLIAKIKSRWARKLEDDANTAFLEKRYEDSAYLARTALGISNERQKDLDSIIKKSNKHIDAAKYDEKTKLSTIDPDNSTKKYDIDILLKEAKIFMKDDRYEQAKDSLEKILIKDPYNSAATDLLEQVYRKLYMKAQKRRELEVIERMAEVNWNWNQGILPTKAIKPKESGPIEKRSSKAGIFEKLQNIVFDKIEFEDASIISVINHLKSRSQQLDPEGNGVGLTLQLSESMNAAPPRVTMSFDNIPMYETIRYLCQQTGLKYRIEEKAILIGDKDIDEMDTRFFSVRAELVSSITGGVSAASEVTTSGVDEISVADTFTKAGAGKKGAKGGGGGGGAAGASATAAAPSATSEALKIYFTDRGVPFETGSSIAYEKRSGKLIVKNTPENLRKLEHLLRELDIQTPLVLIESKILEITQSDLEELGFDWQIQSTINNEGVTAKHAVLPNQYVTRFFQDQDNMNSTSQVLADRPNKLVNNLQLIPNTTDSDYAVSLTVDAMCRSGRGEILSSPKVMATSGKTAIIRMVQEMYFPTSWNTPAVSVSNGSVSYTPAYPSFGETTDIGIRLEVTPYVGSNNYTISLHLNPQVIAFSGFSLYPYVVKRNSVARDGTVTTIASYDQDIKMPQISRRDIDTNVKVFDGETVVLGGIMKNTAKARNDKYPGLGDIPLVGRLFTSTLNYNVKTNLLVFVTTRLMNNDGVPVRANTQRGIPEFNR